MEAHSILNRFQHIAPSLTNQALLQVVCEGKFLFLQTGERMLQRSRLRIKLGSGVGILAGLILARYSLWGWAVVAVSLLCLFFAVRLITSHRLLAIDTVGAQLIPLQNTGTEVGSLSLATLCGLHGVYETKGWDPYSVLYAHLQDGTKIPILLLIGGSEKMASEACHLLGSLLNCPTTYTGAFGDVMFYSSPQ